MADKDILEDNIKYDLKHNLYINKGKIEIKLTPEQAIDIAYAIVDSFGLSYEMLDPLQTAYEEEENL